MGCRLYVAKKYVVEYSHYGEFNWQQEEFRNLMDALGIELCGESSSGELWNFEVSKEDWRRGMETLKSDKDNEEINQALQSIGKTREDMLGIMETYLEESDPDYDWLEFCFLRYNSAVLGGRRILYNPLWSYFQTIQALFWIHLWEDLRILSWIYYVVRLEIKIYPSCYL